MGTQLRRLLETPRAYRACAILACLLLGSAQSSHAQALAARGNIDLKGNNLATDSFDSSAPDYPGYWTNSIRRANGDVVSISAITNSVLNLGNANIAGHTKTGPNGTLLFNANASVGDLAWVDAPTFGIEPGYYTNDFSLFFPDVLLPAIGWLPAAGYGTGGSGIAPNGNTYAHVFTSAASEGYFTLSDSGDIYVDTNVMVTVQVLNGVSTFAPNNLFVAGTGTNSGKLVAYVDCANCTIGTADKSQSGLAQNLIFLGTENCTSVAYAGNGGFAGVIYAPSADFQLSGGGTGVSLDFIGSSITKTIQSNGHYHFHFDEALYHLSFPMLLFSTLPQNRVALVGQNITLNASALGARPLNFQWRFGGSDIPDATNSSLSLTNIQLASAGLYEAAITNISGSITSDVRLSVYDSATPTLQTPAISTSNLFQMTVSGVPTLKYAIEASTNLADWIPVTTNISPYLFSDTNAVLSPQQFYRAVYVP